MLLTFASERLNRRKNEFLEWHITIILSTTTERVKANDKSIYYFTHL